MGSEDYVDEERAYREAQITEAVIESIVSQEIGRDYEISCECYSDGLIPLGEITDRLTNRKGKSVVRRCID